MKERGKENEDLDPASIDATLNMTIKFVHGDNLIADSSQLGGILAACKAFDKFVAGTY